MCGAGNPEEVSFYFSLCSLSSRTLSRLFLICSSSFSTDIYPSSSKVQTDSMDTVSCFLFSAYREVEILTSGYLFLQPVIFLKLSHFLPSIWKYIIISAVWTTPLYDLPKYRSLPDAKSFIIL